MKNFKLCCYVALTIMSLDSGASANTRQGIAVEPKAARPSTSDFVMPDEGTEMAQDGEFPMDNVKNWSGSGSNRAAMVIQWNNDREEAAMVFGYRWDGEATGIDMIRCIVENNPRLYGLFQQTNVSSGKAKWGYTIDGFGWDEDNSGLPVAIYDEANDDTYYSNSGFFEHPRGCNESVSYPDYDYDNWKAVDENDFWQAGWYIGYWSYWLKENDDDVFKYSGIGASGRVLKDGCWDGWNYCPEMEPMYWLPFMAAESLIPEGVETALSYDGINYTLLNYESKSVEVAPGNYSGDIVIPESFCIGDISYNVTAVGAKAFMNSQISSVKLPSTAGKIGVSAFEGSSLTSIEGITQVSQIGSRAFADCRNLNDFTFPELLAEIPDECFAGSGLKEAELPSTISKTGISAFSRCADLRKVSIPLSLLSIGESSFADCPAIIEVKCISTLPPSLVDNVFSTGTYSTATLIVPQGFTDAYSAAGGWRCFSVKDEFLLEVNVGDRFLFHGAPIEITSIDADAPTAKIKCNHFNGVFRVTAVQLANEKLKGDIEVPEYVRYMGRDFKVTRIDPYAFYGAKYITSVKFPKDVEGFGDYMYWNCNKIESATVPDNISRIGDYCFYGCMNLKELTLPDGITEIGKNAFYGCSSLSSLTIPSSVRVIGERAFQSLTGVSEIILPEGLQTIGQYALFGTGITSVEIPESLESIGVYALAGNRKLETVRLPESLVEIPNGLLATSSNLTEVEIPANVTSIGQNFIITSGVKQVYLTNPHASAMPKTFETSTKGIYATVITLPGHAGSLTSEPGYDKTTVTEPTTSSLVQTDASAISQISEDNKLLTISAGLKAGFEENLPERFADYCSEAAIRLHPIGIKVSDIDEILPATINEDNRAEAIIPTPTSNEIKYNWILSTPGHTVISPEYQLQVSSATGINQLPDSFDNSTLCTVITPDGRVLAHNVRWDSLSLTPGIYIVNHKKIIIKHQF